VVFPAGPNFFNVQGYFYFVKRVLPLVRRQAPDFLLEATNMSPCLPHTSEPGVTIHNFIPDLKSFYAKSSFLICPLIAGTGQNVKIIEAMAHGLTVVATKYSQQSSPIEHGVSGFVANSVEEFAEYTIRLWKDKALRKKMGQAAREKIAAEFSRKRLLNDLAKIF
jgi:glycosyltransferase involved in cell wall biosynthesis